MNHTYYIHGMTCNGCRSHVEETLLKVEGVSIVDVHLEKAEAMSFSSVWVIVNALRLRRIKI